MLRRQKWTRSI